MKSWWNWRATVFGRGNLAYRDAFILEDINQTRFVIIVVAAGVFGFFYADYLAFNSTGTFFQLLALRVIYLVASFGLVVHLPKLRNVDAVDIAILVWSIAGVIIALISIASREAVSLVRINFHYLWVLGFYLLLPNRQLFKTIPALAVSGISIYTLFNHGSNHVQSMMDFNILVNVSTIIAINVIGFISALQLDVQRYRQFLIQKTLLAGREQLIELAITDSLTGILNRRGFLEMAEVEFDRFNRYGNIFSFVIFDLDKLKSINDTYGHPTGDLAIKYLIEVINREKRASDITGRLAGDEFGILLPNTGAEQAFELMLRMQNVVMTEPAKLPAGQLLQVRFSAGITNVTKKDHSFDDIYRRADKALLSAKHKGSNRIEKA